MDPFVEPQAPLKSFDTGSFPDGGGSGGDGDRGGGGGDGDSGDIAHC